MVMRFGMSERLGPRVFGHDRSQPFLGREFSAEPDYSDEIAREIDDEIRRIVEAAHQTAKDLLTDKHDELDRISKILLERETIDADQFVALLDGKSEDEVFADEEESAKPVEPAPSPARPQRGGARPAPRPRPGFAGGDVS
jgi:cell division protease FtsH